MLPLPVKYRMYFGEPLHFEGDASDDDAAIQEKVDVVKDAIEGMLARGVRERKGIFTLVSRAATFYAPRCSAAGRQRLRPRSRWPVPAPRLRRRPLPRSTLPRTAGRVGFPEHVLFVSVAGLTPGGYRDDGVRPPVMPTLAALARAGAAADAVTTVAPAARYPAHATLVTGQLPAAHGIVADRLTGDRGVRARAVLAREPT